MIVRTLTDDDLDAAMALWAPTAQRRGAPAGAPAPPPAPPPHQASLAEDQCGFKK
jgi:hypothetical protein